MRRCERRAGSLLALTVLMGSLATSGLCFMERSTGTGDAHSCCRTGLTSAPPPCCMAALSDQVPAKAAVRFELTAPTMVAEITTVSTALEVRHAALLVPACPPSSSPPRYTVLRI